MHRGRLFRTLVVLGTLAALAACERSALAPRQTDTAPQTRPAALVAPPPVAKPEGPSAASSALAAYYARLQQDLLARGLLRVDGGGPDTVFTDTMLARNFEAIALGEEYERRAGLTPNAGRITPAVKKWEQPVRLRAEFAGRISDAQIDRDRATLAHYADRLADLTGHPIAISANAPNFHVLFADADALGDIGPRIRALVPRVDPATLRLFDDLHRDVQCLVVAFATERGGHVYEQAIAVIRTEHPDLLRRACIHEEVAQGLGLANDSPHARPSIFNDDDEFALLTTHDEMLLRILYDPALEPGMTADQAMPIVRRRAAVLTGDGA